MADPQDRIEIGGVERPAAVPGSSGPASARAGRKWLSVWFNCCKVYDRMYLNAEGTRYRGRCPSCGSSVTARVGEGGTSRRMFETR